MTNTTHPARRLRHGDRPTEQLTFEDAAANKAAEEGGLPADKNDWLHTANELDKGSAGGYIRKRAAEIIRQAIAADRASRQVANKAEVEPWYMTRLHDMGTVYKADGTMVAQTYGACAKAFMDAHNASLATPPATTGASTAGLETVLDRLENAIGGYSGGPFNKVQAIIDELRAVPDCGACPGDGSMCKSRCKVEEESPASTVLTDERIETEFAHFCDREGYPSDSFRDDDLRSAFRAGAAIEREVAAQAGQVAVPDDLLERAAKIVESHTVVDEDNSEDSKEEFAWAVFAENGNVIIWSKNRAQVESSSKKYGRPIVPVIALSAAQQAAAPGASESLPALTPAQRHADELLVMLQRVRKVDERAGYQTDLTDAVAALLEKVAATSAPGTPEAPKEWRKALHAAVSAIYFDDSSDYRWTLGAVVRHLDAELAAELLSNPKVAYDRSAAQLDGDQEGSDHA